MYIEDDLCGSFKLESILEELILSAPVQRLKGIHQGGAGYLVNEKWNVTRYEHSVGVMLLIRKLGGSLEEQIAGLLHDVSHTAFSHVIDFVFEHEDEDYHEQIFHNVVENSEIPDILTKHGYRFEDILLDDTKWTLLEQPAPELCADRVDYTLRDMYRYGQITLSEATHFLDELIVIHERMYPSNIESAEWIVETYYKEVIDFFMDPLNIYANDRLAHLLKLALEKKVLTASDFLLEDAILIDRVRNTNDRELQELLKQLHPQVKVTEDRKHYHLHRKNKLRMLDPSVLHNSKWFKASSISKKVRMMGDEAYEKAVRGMYVKVL
ncbi:HD domain-containing protein [Jeotgalibacillus haloalkalitolerans]|uniref:HD domain-containing protein n=1 Tax=Jeotgalibacillus haloalkalitolerans TaxID=3104292 RepID=A0ABU5KIZ9_9BACL|nr:HD domain-containing protein [Jeotgalibacillus sp. HH7-29]MDZ5710700.1 HD domain-containing protein [Jeotgalibacillus sp. HH7-29]